MRLPPILNEEEQLRFLEKYAKRRAWRRGFVAVVGGLGFGLAVHLLVIWLIRSCF